jgi:hypothetical protein
MKEEAKAKEIGRVGNLTPVSAYLKPRQVKELEDLKMAISKEYNISISSSELIRDGIELLMDNCRNGGLKAYLEFKGWL